MTYTPEQMRALTNALHDAEACVRNLKSALDAASEDQSILSLVDNAVGYAGNIRSYLSQFERLGQKTP